jgi:hypothetical protein
MLDGPSYTAGVKQTCLLQPGKSLMDFATCGYAEAPRTLQYCPVPSTGHNDLRQTHLSR